MNPRFSIVPALLASIAFAAAAVAADPPAPVVSASDLAARLNAWQQDGASYVRLRMVVKPSGKEQTAMQVQIKARRTKGGAEVLYQILWPKERKGEGVLLRKSTGGATTGSMLVPPNDARPLNAADLRDPLFGSDLSWEDAVENFFAWEGQSIAGNDDVRGIGCQILESKPGRNDRSSYTKVRTWIDTRRLVPLRIEKYAGDRLVRRIDTTNVVKDDIGRHIPANLEVRGARRDSITELDGSRIKHDVSYPDNQFTADALKEVTIPRSSE